MEFWALLLRASEDLMKPPICPAFRANYMADDGRSFYDPFQGEASFPLLKCHSNLSLSFLCWRSLSMHFGYVNNAIKYLLYPNYLISLVSLFV
jgi:hypothetical protein